MKTLKWARWSGLILLAVLAAGPVAAQSSPTTAQGGSAGQRADLQLTDDQKTKMQEIRKSSQEQIKAVHNDAALTGEQKREKVREINRNTDQQVKGVLNDDQYRRYQRRAHDRREDVRDRREDRRDRREDVRDRRHDGGVRDEREDVRDRREDRRDRAEDRRDRRHGSKPRPPKH